LGCTSFSYVLLVSLFLRSYSAGLARKLAKEPPALGNRNCS